jgi:hypothetical protein
MKVRNVHEREMRGSMQQLSEIVKTYGSKNDRMYPFERWPKMQLEGPEGPPTVGRIGNRGAAQFVMTLYENGERIRYSWKFLKPVGFDGHHHGEAQELGNGKILFRSVVDMNTRGLKATLLWLFVMRPLHDAVVEDSFDKVERELGSSPMVHEWSPWVKFLRRLKRRNSLEYQRLHREQLERYADV